MPSIFAHRQISLNFMHFSSSLAISRKKYVIMYICERIITFILGLWMRQPFAIEEVIGEVSIDHDAIQFRFN